MTSIYKAQKVAFSYDIGTSTAEGRAVSSVFEMPQNAKVTIILSSGTANFQLWANNDTPYLNAVNNYQALMANDQFNSMKKFDASNPSFSANWVNITTHPLMYLTTTSFTLFAPYRFLRLQGASVSGSSSAELGQLWSDGCIPGN